MNALITHGLDLISLLIPQSADKETLKTFISQMLVSMEKILNSTSLLLLKTSCDFMMKTFPQDAEDSKVILF